MDTENFNIDLNKLVALLIREIVALRVESTRQRALINVLYKRAFPDLDFEASLQAQAQSLAEDELQSLLQRFALESDELAAMIQSLLD